MMNSKRIICWNVNGIRAWSKKGCLEWIIEQNPDIFCFQETKAHPDQLDTSLLNIDGYTSYFDHSKLKKGYSGVAVYSKEKPTRVDSDLLVENSEGKKEIDQEGRFIALYFENYEKAPNKKLNAADRQSIQGKKGYVFINCYFPNGGGESHRLEYKLRFYKAFHEYIKNSRKEGYNVIFCGDLNVAHTEIDIARPKENQNHVGFLPVERKWVDGLIADGFIDTFRFLNPEVKERYSWWDVKSGARNRNIGWRIDYFFVDNSLRENILDAKIHSDIYGSDHCPIFLNIKI